MSTTFYWIWEESIFKYTPKGLVHAADPESFVRGGPNLITFILFFYLMRG